MTEQTDLKLFYHQILASSEGEGEVHRESLVRVERQTLEMVEGVEEVGDLRSPGRVEVEAEVVVVMESQN